MRSGRRPGWWSVGAVVGLWVGLRLLGPPAASAEEAPPAESPPAGEDPTDDPEDPEDPEADPAKTGKTRKRARPRAGKPPVRNPDAPRVLVLPSISFNRDDGFGAGLFLGARKMVRGGPSGMPSAGELLDEVGFGPEPAGPADSPDAPPTGPEDPPDLPRPDLSVEDRGGRPGEPASVESGIAQPAARVPGDRRPWIWDLSLVGMAYFKPIPVAWGFAGGLSIFPEPSARTELNLTVSSHGWNQDWWFGLGNATRREMDRRTDDEPVLDAYHRFGLYQLRVDLRAQRKLTRAFELFAGAIFTVNVIDLRDATLLEAQAGVLKGANPVPTAGAGFFSTIAGGFRVDTRDVRFDPTRGVLLLGTAEGTAGTTGTYGRFTLDLRGYIGPPEGQVVFAGEALGQIQLGDVPFYDYGVLSGPEARPRTLSGVDGLRGLDRGRYRGPLGLLLHGEVRFRPPGFALLPVLDVRLEPNLFVDAIRVDRFEALGEGPPLHPGFGGGVRIILNEQVVVRVDVGTAPELVIDEAGLEATRWTVGAYGTIHQSF